MQQQMLTQHTAGWDHVAYWLVKLLERAYVVRMYRPNRGCPSLFRDSNAVVRQGITNK